MKPLEGKIALVAGGTRGGGRGIAVMLGAAGATVYVTGRSMRTSPSPMGRPETIEETVELINAHGGMGIPVRVDHANEQDVKKLFQQIDVEQRGHLDILVNSVWGGDPLSEWNVPFWNQDLEKGRKILKQAVYAHILTSRYGVPLMIGRDRGIVIEVTDGIDYSYRGTLFYSLAKVSAIHLAQAVAADFRKHQTHLASVALTPGYMRSEAVLDAFGVTEVNWQEGIKIDPNFAKSETPYYVGRAAMALASDPDIEKKSGSALSSCEVALEYGFTDVDGRQPVWDW